MAESLEKWQLVEAFDSLRVNKRGNGFTMDIYGRESNPQQGFAVGVKSYFSIEEAVQAVQPHQHIGYWIGEGGEEHVDIVEIYAGKVTALLAAYCRGQMCVYDFAADDIIDCSSFYKEKIDEKVASFGVFPQSQADEEGPEAKAVPAW